MPKGTRINAAQPYSTISPRRALHPANNQNGVLHGKVVRQAYVAPQCCIDNQQRYLQTSRVGGGTSSETCDQASARLGVGFTRTNFQQVPGQGYFGYWTNFTLCVAPKCAEQITAAVEYCQQTKGNITRINPYFGYTTSPYDGLAMSISVIPRVGYGISGSGPDNCPANTTVDTSNNCEPLPPVSTTAAINVLPTINPAITLNPAGQTITSQAIHVLPTIDPAISINKPSCTHKHDAQLPSSTSLGIATTAAGALSIATAYLTPTPTATIAASVAPSYAIGTVAAAAGAVIGGAAVGLAAYGGYKLVKYLEKEPFQNSGHSLEEAQEFVNKAFSDEEPRYTELQSDEHIYETLEEAKTEHAA